VVRISEDEEISTLAGPPPANDKYEGGVVGPDGALYCMPLNSKHVMRIVPGERRPKGWLRLLTFGLVG